MVIAPVSSNERNHLRKLEGQIADARNSLVYEFTQILVGLSAPIHGMSAHEITRVTAAWGYTESDFYWIAGFIVGLIDGRMAYLSGFCDADTNHHAAKVTVSIIDESVSYSSLGPRTLPNGEVVQWITTPDALNELLRHLDGRI